ncbi:hypothetical protein ABZ848_15365 [Streptomyces sp. NPDC047081]|uniref:hypothetical protein n=1 Tax=Streptomyces sp. NPDC047081 TaxID=3154706 RepID=UPI0033C37804
MRADITSGHGVDLLIGLADDTDADRIRARIGLPSYEPTGLATARRRLRTASPWKGTYVLSSVLLWVLEEDDPDLNVVVWPRLSGQAALRRAVLRGVPFGSGTRGPVPVDDSLRHLELPVPERVTRLGTTGALYAATTMSAAREAADTVCTREDWRTVAEAHGERPLPGYARWALSIRPDCPPALRARFGSHRKFTNRVRQAGVLDGPAEYATTHAPAAQTLGTLSAGPVMFPARVREAEDALRPLVREHLGGREEAWAVLAQLLGTFHGSVPELVVTAGAIA